MKIQNYKVWSLILPLLAYEGTKYVVILFESEDG